jgi:hypothetical protein
VWNALFAVILFAASCSAVNAPAPSTVPLYSFTVPGEPALHLDIFPVFVNGRPPRFFDHRVDQHTNLLLAVGSGGYLYYSTDMARTWTKVPDSARAVWHEGFVTEQRNLLLWDGHQIQLLDLEGKVLATHADAPYPWHGSEGIGQRGSTILYAEYSVRQAKELRVFRSADQGKTWSVVFRQFTDMSDTPQIRHFHLVQPDPYHPGHWYLSSGDTPPQCKVWLSKDDGKTWTDVTDPHPVGAKSQSVHRFTSLVFTKDYLWWATDDKRQNGKAVMVRAKRRAPLRVEVVGTLREESVRSSVITDYGLLLISEAWNPASGGSYVHLFTADGRVILVGIIPRGPDPKLQSHVTWSLGSKAAVNHEFFTAADGRMFRTGPGVGTVMWRVK